MARVLSSLRLGRHAETLAHSRVAWLRINPIGYVPLRRVRREEARHGAGARVDPELLEGVLDVRPDGVR